MWSEFRRLALETSEMAPWLISSRPRLHAWASVTGVDSGAFVADDGTILLVAVNTLGDPVSVSISLNTSDAEAAPAAHDGGALPSSRPARVLFASGYREIGVRQAQDGTWAVEDIVDALGTRVYLLRPDGPQMPPAEPVLPTPTKDPLAANLIFNGDIEFASSVGVPDGWCP
jgi:hypothetical protein